MKEETPASVEGKIKKWEEIKTEYDKWLPTIDLKWRTFKRMASPQKPKAMTPAMFIFLIFLLLVLAAGFAKR